MKIGKHGGQKPTETILGNSVETHFHKQGVGDGYYVVVENYPIDNLDELIDDIEKEIKKLTRVAKPKTKKIVEPTESDTDES